MNAWAIALDSIWSHRTRSALTALGVVIGVFAVVTLVALGNGVSQFVTSQFKVFGADLVTVTPAFPGGAQATRRLGARRGGARVRLGQRSSAFGGLGSAPSTLTVADANAILAAHAASIAHVAPVASLPALVSVGQTQAPGAAVVGTTAPYFGMEHLSFAHGGFAAGGAVLGQTVARTLFPGVADPVGRSVTVAGHPFRVVGLLGASGNHFGGDPDNTVYVPISEGLKLVGLTTVSDILVQARSNGQVNAASSAARAVLDRRHPSQDFALTTATQILSTITSTLSVITSFLAGLAAIALVVGGIGIMNIMLVTVTERFREIGIRKALGARDGDILVQFLAESVLLAVLGGGVGIVLSAAATRIVSRVVGIPAGLDGSAIGLALGFSVLVGAAFGVLPALRAARLLPAEALRSE
jgi:putative ABC transport system permease protein